LARRQTRWCVSGVFCAAGSGQRGWDRPLGAHDGFLIAVGPGSSRTITDDLATALLSFQAPSTAPLPQAQRQALAKLTNALTLAWNRIVGSNPSQEEINSILQLVAVLKFDVASADRTAAIETLAHVMTDASTAPGAFVALTEECERLMAARHGTGSAALRRALAQAGC